MQSFGSCQRMSRKLSGSHQTVVSESSGSHQAVIWQSSGNVQAVIWQSSGSHLAVIWKSSGSHLAVIWQSSGSHLAVIWQSSAGHQAVIFNYFHHISKGKIKLQPVVFQSIHVRSLASGSLNFPNLPPYLNTDLAWVHGIQSLVWSSKQPRKDLRKTAC